MEKHILATIKQNLSAKFFLEALVSFGPMFLDLSYQLNPLVYGTVKLVRYGRLFEMDSQCKEIIEHSGRDKTVFELKQMQKDFDIF